MILFVQCGVKTITQKPIACQKKFIVMSKLLQEMMDVWISSNASFLMSSPAILQAHYKKYRIFIAENNKKR